MVLGSIETEGRQTDAPSRPGGVTTTGHVTGSSSLVAIETPGRKAVP